MKIAFRIRTALAALIASAPLAIASAAPDEAREVWASETITVTVEGTSTLHAWSVSSQTAAGTVQLARSGIAAAGLTIPSKSLSGGPSGLNGRMYTALKADRFPTIAFELGRVSGFDAELALGQAQTWQVEGSLDLAGTKRPVSFTSRVEQNAAGGLVILVETKLRMTDFGIMPPTFMGMIKTGDEVRVRIQWSLRPGGATIPAT